MKYLKTYEQNKEKLKNYIVWEYKNKIVVFEIKTQYDNSPISLKRVNLYNIKKNYIEEIKLEEHDKMIYYKNINEIKDGLLYQSDNLKDCIDKVKYLSDIKKYNI